MDEEEDPDIAALMGFGSFGGTKKRKFEQTNSPKSKIDASGANSTQLGVRVKSDLDDDYHKLYSTNDAILISNPPDEAQPQSQAQRSKGKGKLKQPETGGLAAFLARAHDPQRMASPVEQTAQPSTEDQSIQNTNVAIFSYGGPPVSESELYALRRGIKNEAGDMAYFLPSFVENPWQKLEQQHR